MLETYDYESAYVDGQGLPCIKCRDTKGEELTLQITTYRMGNRVIIMERGANRYNVYNLEAGKDVTSGDGGIVIILNNKSILIKDERHIQTADSLTLNQPGGFISKFEVIQEISEEHSKTKTVKCYYEEYGAINVIFDVEGKYNRLMGEYLYRSNPDVTWRSSPDIPWNTLFMAGNKQTGEVKMIVSGVGEKEYSKEEEGYWFKFKNKEVWVNSQS